ncbi:MAG: hypothetical protein KA354_24550 [Phycisphaerae bacterium]|nr:hypothetical protein [Phycisphaerae bacterium]
MPPPAKAARPRRAGLGADTNSDADVDQDDFGLFQRCYGGTGKLPDPNCAN